MARILTISEYGALASILAIFGIIVMPANAIQNTIIKYSAINREPGRLKYIFRKSMSKVVGVSALVFLVYLIAIYPLSGYMKIGYFALAVGGLMIFANFLNPITRGLLLGEKKFRFLGVSVIVEGLVKILLSAVFVISLTGFGLAIFRIHSAVLGAISGAFISFLVSLWGIRYILKSKEKRAKVKDIYLYVRPAFFITLAIFIFVGLDIIIAKIVFDPDTAGAYAMASTLGKIIYFGSGPISKAMFPITSSEDWKKKKSNKLLLQALSMVVGLIVIALVVILMFPELLVNIFSGKDVPLASDVLIYTGLAAGFISITNLLLLYRLSIGKTKLHLILLIFPIVEALLLFSFSGSILSFSVAFLSAAIIFLIGSIIFASYEKE